MSAMSILNEVKDDPKPGRSDEISINFVAKTLTQIKVGEQTKNLDEPIRNSVAELAVNQAVQYIGYRVENATERLDDSFTRLAAPGFALASSGLGMLVFGLFSIFSDRSKQRKDGESQ